jgi:hypothetical protein
MCISTITYHKKCPHTTVKPVRICRSPASCDRVQFIDSARPRARCVDCEQAWDERQARESTVVWWKKGERVNMEREGGGFVDVEL